MSWYDAVFEFIDMRSFSNLWYWIALAVLWSTLSHFIIGVPFDMIQRAERYGGQAERDLNDVTRIYVNRIMFVARQSGHWIVGIGFTVLTMLAVLGFGYLMGFPDYEFEFAQAVFLLAFPTALVMSLSYRTAAERQRSGQRGTAALGRRSGRGGGRQQEQERQEGGSRGRSGPGGGARTRGPGA